MSTFGWIAAVIVALSSFLNVTSTNALDKQGFVETSPEIPIVFDEAVVPTETILEPLSLLESVAEVREKSEESATYVPVSKREPVVTPKQESVPTREPSCHPSYSGCLNPNASDYDCAGGSGNGPYYTGPVKVYGPDVFDLDRDGDGVACE